MREGISLLSLALEQSNCNSISDPLFPSPSVYRALITTIKSVTHRLEISLILNRLVFLVFEIFFELLDLLSQAVHVVLQKPKQQEETKLHRPRKFAKLVISTLSFELEDVHNISFCGIGKIIRVAGKLLTPLRTESDSFFQKYLQKTKTTHFDTLQLHLHHRSNETEHGFGISTVYVTESASVPVWQHEQKKQKNNTVPHKYIPHSLHTTLSSP